MGCRRYIRDLYKRVKALQGAGGSGGSGGVSPELLAEVVAQIPTNVSELNNDAGYLTQATVTANEPFPSSWPKNGNINGLINAINNDSSATQGKIYLATVSYNDLPAGLAQAEMKVEITVGGSGNKVMLFTVTSENVSPYHWERTSAYGRTGTWRSFLNNGDISNLVNNNTLQQLRKQLSYGSDPNGYTYVDLGLPSGTLWCNKNVGAYDDVSHGYYYKWGSFEQYDGSYSYAYYEEAEMLPLEYDTANHIQGGDWHIPTKAQIQELIANTTATWENMGGTVGIRFTAPNENYIQFPVSGYYDDQEAIQDTNTLSIFWSSEAGTTSGTAVVVEMVDPNTQLPSVVELPIDCGLPVRGVLDYPVMALTLPVSPDEKTAWNGKANIWRGTQAEYDLIQTPDNNTIYIITAPTS